MHNSPHVRALHSSGCARWWGGRQTPEQGPRSGALRALLSGHAEPQPLPRSCPGAARGEAARRGRRWRAWGAGTPRKASLVKLPSECHVPPGASWKAGLGPTTSLGSKLRLVKDGRVQARALAKRGQPVPRSQHWGTQARGAKERRAHQGHARTRPAPARKAWLWLSPGGGLPVRNPEGKSGSSPPPDAAALPLTCLLMPPYTPARSQLLRGPQPGQVHDPPETLTLHLGAAAGFHRRPPGRLPSWLLSRSTEARARGPPWQDSGRHRDGPRDGSPAPLDHSNLTSVPRT